LNSIAEKLSETRRYPLEVYRGLRFGLVLHLLGAPEAYLEGAATRKAMLSRDAHGARAILNALDRLAGGSASQAATTGKDLAIAEGQLRDDQARLGQPFAHDTSLVELTRLRDQLKAGLSGATPERVTEPVPVTELAERIKALRATHTLESAPQRSLARTSATAEEPVTARIRRRRGEPLSPQPADATEPTAVPTDSPLPTTATTAADARPAHTASPAPTPAPTEEEPALFRLAADGPAASRSRPPYRDGIAHAQSRKPLQTSLV
jgi:hypothetical protein